MLDIYMYHGGEAKNADAAVRKSNTPVLKHAQDARSAGGMPVWGQPETNKEKIAQQITDVLSGNTQDFSNSVEGNAFANANASIKSQGSEAFGFGDLLDMANPLQHIPIVNFVYREVTGDTIKPVSSLIGGAAFGGVMGAAGGLANIIMKEETGQDMNSMVKNAIFAPTTGYSLGYSSENQKFENTEHDTDQADGGYRSTKGFEDITLRSYAADYLTVIENYQNDRTYGAMPEKIYKNARALVPEREEISKVNFDNSKGITDF